MQRFELNGSGQVVPGETFEIAASVNLATGARLTVEAPAGVAALGSERSAASGFGGGGKTVYWFSCQAPGDYTIYFKKGRPWEQRQDVAAVTLECRSV